MRAGDSGEDASLTATPRLTLPANETPGARWTATVAWHFARYPAFVMAGGYAPRSPTTGVLYGVVRTHWSELAATVRERTDGVGLPSFVISEFRKFLRCGVLAHGFARIRCGDCAFERLVSLVPRPRIHLLIYHGVLAPNAPWRRSVVAREEESSVAASVVVPAPPSGDRCDDTARGQGPPYPPALPELGRVHAAGV
jgi:hypothetical protein